MPIIISSQGRKTIRIEKSRFGQEADLQKYIAENPEALPLDQIKQDVKFAILERESPTGVGPIDILAVDNDGEIYLIETKLYRNSDKRRVLAQVLDYGASLWASTVSPGDWIQRLDQRLVQRNGAGLAEKLANDFGESQETIDSIKENLATGSYRFLVLMDEVPDTLKDLILYINQNSRFTVYAIELEVYHYQDSQILIPHVFGAENKRKAVSSPHSERGQWDEDSFFMDVQSKVDAATQEAIRKVYNFAKIELAAEIGWGTGKSKGSFNPKVLAISVRSLFTVYSDGVLSLNYAWLDDNEHPKKCGTIFKSKMMNIKPFKAKIEATKGKYPYLQPNTWVPICEQFIQAVREMIHECQASVDDSGLVYR